ncbi:hypothetical protein QBC34DRAFT_377633 [Podospora aff. communis PSN243]|uniref:Uncharacterized protein n=1 Tax=Podospora aff. communis PSN243 TaxID=3040156 RepID=A0AAV9GXJ6_9PEZI|nr:hypothetical protein QBC34DRAFT_377633 [Podospora aff. communis PSN243]
MSSESSLSDDSSILAPDGPDSETVLLSEAASHPQEQPHYEYQTFERPNGGETNTKARLIKLVMWMVVLLFLVGVVYVCIKLSRW